MKTKLKVHYDVIKLSCRTIIVYMRIRYNYTLFYKNQKILS